jgi:hypothetical protein
LSKIRAAGASAKRPLEIWESRLRQSHGGDLGSEE